MKNEHRELTIEQAAQASGVSHWTLRRWLKMGATADYRRVGNQLLFAPGTVVTKPPKVKP
jgi:predicted site-specific integrase-resolvase